MKPRNFPMRKALRRAGWKRKHWPPEVSDIKVRAGATARSVWLTEPRYTRKDTQ